MKYIGIALNRLLLCRKLQNVPGLAVWRRGQSTWHNVIYQELNKSELHLKNKTVLIKHCHIRYFVISKSNQLPTQTNFRVYQMSHLSLSTFRSLELFKARPRRPWPWPQRIIFWINIFHLLVDVEGIFSMKNVQSFNKQKMWK